MITNKFLESLNLEFKDPKNCFLSDLIALRVQFLNDSVLRFLHIQGVSPSKISQIEEMLDQLNEACLSEDERAYIDACESRWKNYKMKEVL